MNIDLRKTQAHLDWLKQKLFLDAMSKNAVKRTVKRGQVYNCELGMGVGSEFQKKRPCVIVQNDIGNANSPVTTIVPITHTQKSLDCFVSIANKYDQDGKLILDGYVNVSGIRSIDKARIGDYICDNAIFNELKKLIDVDDNKKIVCKLKKLLDKSQN